MKKVEAGRKRWRHELLRVYLSVVFHPSVGFDCQTLVSQYHFRQPVLLLAASAEGHRTFTGTLLYLLASCECPKCP